MTEAFRANLEVATVEQARSWLRLHMEKGAYCPCCTQYVKKYRRALSSQMARWLIWLVKNYQHACGPRCTAPQDVWVDIKKCPVRGGDYAKTIHWDLARQKPGDGIDPPRGHGLWQPTIKGIDFVYDRLEVPSHAVIYNNQLLAMTETTVDVVKVLGKHFDYQKLMAQPAMVDMEE